MLVSADHLIHETPVRQLGKLGIFHKPFTTWKSAKNTYGFMPNILTA
jgi:hypothetical protein